MAITYSTAIQDEIALRLSRRSYSDLTADQKKMIDGGATPPSVTSGAVKRAMDTIESWAVFLTLDPTEGIPLDWTGWLVALSALKAASGFSTADEGLLRREEAMARDDALRTYQRSAITSTAATDHFLVTAIELRRFVVSHCVSMPRPVLPTPEQIDAAIVETLEEVWDMADWSFRRALVTLTLGTDDSVTVDPDIDIDRLATESIVYVGSSSGSTGGEAREVDADTMMRLKAKALADGKPRYFRLIDSDGGITWILDRTPDQEYTAKAEVLKEIGDLTTPTEIGTAAALFPKKFQPYLRKRVLATTLENLGRYNEADALEREAREYEEMLAQFDSPRSAPEMDPRRQASFGMGALPMGGQIGGFV